MNHCKKIGLEEVCENSCGCFKSESVEKEELGEEVVTVEKETAVEDEIPVEDETPVEEETSVEEETPVGEEHTISVEETTEEEESIPVKIANEYQNKEENILQQIEQAEEAVIVQSEITQIINKETEKKTQETIENEIITKLLSENKQSQQEDTGDAIEAQNIDELKAESILIDTPFNELIKEMLDEGKKCEGACWRPCLKSNESQNKTLECIQSCGCGEDSAQLLVVQNEITNLPIQERQRSFTIFAFLFLAILATGAIYFVLKRESDKKMHERMEYDEEIGENGYEKLD